MVVELTAKQRRELARMVARAAESAQVVRRAHVVRWSADGVSGAEIARRLHLSAEAVSRIRRRFLETGIAGLATRPKPGRTDYAVPAATVERIVALAMSPPPAGRSRWTTRLLAKEVGLSSGCVSDLLRRNDLKPHRVRMYTSVRVRTFTACRAGASRPSSRSPRPARARPSNLQPPQHAVLFAHQPEIPGGVEANALRLQPAFDRQRLDAHRREGASLPAGHDLHFRQCR
jgi:transposase